MQGRRKDEGDSGVNKEHHLDFVVAEVVSVCV